VLTQADNSEQGATPILTQERFHNRLQRLNLGGKTWGKILWGRKKQGPQNEQVVTTPSIDQQAGNTTAEPQVESQSGLTSSSSNDEHSNGGTRFHQRLQRLNPHSHRKHIEEEQTDQSTPSTEQNGQVQSSESTGVTEEDTPMSGGEKTP